MSDHIPTPDANKPRQILWRFYAQQTLLCASATERPIAFDNKDRPGIMLASALRTYVNRYPATPAQRVAIFTKKADGHRTASDLRASGVPIAAVIDTCADAPLSPDYQVLRGAQVVDSKGRLGLTFIDMKLADGSTRTVECAALGVSGGWNPNVHLTCHQRGRPTWDDSHAAFLPGHGLPLGMAVAGAAQSAFSTHAALSSGAHTGAQMFGIKAAEIPHAEDAPIEKTPFWVAAGASRAKLDQQNDVTVKDLKLSHQEMVPFR
ncbi:hypothetical protein [Sulfitobacter sp.]|uniref:hypothetical protein n=1 Tax=Sulfitobacter sp. TaxID=1903071 RepID=UPI0030013C9C